MGAGIASKMWCLQGQNQRSASPEGVSEIAEIHCQRCQSGWQRFVANRSAFSAIPDTLPAHPCPFRANIEDGPLIGCKAKHRYAGHSAPSARPTPIPGIGRVLFGSKISRNSRANARNEI